MINQFAQMMVMMMVMKLSTSIATQVMQLNEPPYQLDTQTNTQNFMLYHGTPVNYHILIKEGLVPVTRKQTIQKVLDEMDRVLGYVPAEARGIAEESYDYYRKRHRAGIYLTNSKDLAKFYAGLGTSEYRLAGGETFLEILRAAYTETGHYEEYLSAYEVFESRKQRTLYVLTLRVPFDMLIPTYGTKESLLVDLDSGKHVPEIRVTDYIPPSMILAVEEFVLTSPEYIKLPEGQGYRQLGIQEETELKLVWRVRS